MRTGRRHREDGARAERRTPRGRNLVRAMGAIRRAAWHPTGSLLLGFRAGMDRRSALVRRNSPILGGAATSPAADAVGTSDRVCSPSRPRLPRAQCFRPRAGTRICRQRRAGAKAACWHCCGHRQSVETPRASLSPARGPESGPRYSASPQCLARGGRSRTSRAG